MFTLQHTSHLTSSVAEDVYKVLATAHIPSRISDLLGFLSGAALVKQSAGNVAKID